MWLHSQGRLEYCRSISQYKLSDLDDNKIGSNGVTQYITSSCIWTLRSLLLNLICFIAIITFSDYII